MTLRTTLRAALFGATVLALTATGALADMLADIKSAGKIVTATEMHYAPFDMLENGQYAGFGKELFDEVAKELGVTAEYQDLPWASILPGLEVSKFDFVIVTGAWNATPSPCRSATRPWRWSSPRAAI